MHEPNGLNTALHVACKHNHMVQFIFDMFFKILSSRIFLLKYIARYCLDNGAYVDSLNKDGNTPLFSAAERFSSTCAKVIRNKYEESYDQRQ